MQLMWPVHAKFFFLLQSCYVQDLGVFILKRFSEWGGNHKERN